jgi:hypothetical protein
MHFYLRKSASIQFAGFAGKKTAVKVFVAGISYALVGVLDQQTPSRKPCPVVGISSDLREIDFD